MYKKFKKYFLFLTVCFTMTMFLQAQVFSEKNPPVRFEKDRGEDPKEFFEYEYRQFWDSLSEVEQFAIACSSNIFERNNQFHLDFSNHIRFNKYTREGVDILNSNWEIFNYDQLMENFNDLSEGEQNLIYIKLKNLLEQYPDLSVIEIGKKEDLTITEVSRMYLVKDMKEILGEHNIEAWIDARRISIIRWGIGAGYISLKEATNLLRPVIRKIKDDYTDFEEFIAHWVAGYCFNEVYNSTCPECTEKLLAAIDSARAYIPFEELPFTGKNADKTHCMRLSECVYTPSEEAAKMIPIQKIYKNYWSEEPSVSILQEFIKEEENYPEISDLLLLPRYVLMWTYSSAKERISYVESKLDYINSLPETSQTYSFVIQVYLNDLNKTYNPQKVIDIYENLNNPLQTNENVYFQYGYSYYLLASSCQSIIERDIYISRAAVVFKRLKSRGYDIGENMNCWLESVE